MASGWQNKLARLSQMSWDEVSTRAAQELHKRSDLFRHQLGLGRSIVPINRGISRRGQFFFSADEASQRAHLVRTHLPQEALAVLHEADDICHHRMRLLGYDNLEFGPDIDWHLDRVHNKRAPLSPWFQIPFLEFASVGDHKVIWELNRHQHFVTLARAWMLSRNEKYSRELMSQWHSWIKANPYPLGVNWASSLEVAFRSLSWVWVDHLIVDAPGYAEFREQLLPELAFHGRYIERYLSTYFSPNTHLLGEAVALFFLGTLYPQVAIASRWQEIGWKTILREAGNQVRSDGVYFEQSLYYHVYALDFFLHARNLAAKNGLDVPSKYDATLNRMLDVIRSLSQAGPPEGFGDDDGGRLFNPRRNRTEHMTDPLAIGTVIYGRQDLPAARLTEESIWMFGEQGVGALSTENAASTFHSIAFPDGGIYVATDDSPYRNEIVIDGGPQGTGRSGHGHADALSLRLSVDGRRWLIDSGSGVYVSADPADRNTFRGTAAHNTLRVDGVDQAVPGDSFSWSAIPSTRVENWTTGKTFSYFSGSHDGYTRLADPVTHARLVVKIGGRLCLVRDVASGAKEHALEVFWHFAPEIDVRPSEMGAVAAPIASDADFIGPAMTLTIPEKTAWRTEITRGLSSPAYGNFEPAALARTHISTQLPAEIATLLTLHAAVRRHAEQPRLISMRHASVQIYELVESDANHGFCFALDKRPWNFGPWFSDAEFLYCRIEKERLTQLIVVGGTSVAWQGQPILEAPKPSGFFEWLKKDGLPSDGAFSVTSRFHDLTGSAPLSKEALSASNYVEKH